MKVTIEKGMVTDLFISEKTGAQYATVQSENGSFKFTSRKGGHDLSKLPRMEAMKIRATLHGRIFQGGVQSLEIVDFAVDALDAKKG